MLPTGELYGRVPAEIVPEMAQRADAGEVIPDLLRGRIGFKPAAQAALIFAHQQLGIVARDALTIASIRWVDDDHAEVRILRHEAR